MRRLLTALDQRPWAVAAIAACGVTLLVPAGLALVVPPELLDAAIALGDGLLALALLALFAVTAVAVRLAIGRHDPADEVERMPAPPVERSELAARPYLR